MISVKEDEDSGLWALKNEEANFCLKYGEDLGEISCSCALLFPQASDTSLSGQETWLDGPLEWYDTDSFIKSFRKSLWLSIFTKYKASFIRG